MQVADEIKLLTCIRCPLGCSLEVTVNKQGTVREVSGYSCGKGKEYAVEEAVNPCRVITTSIMVPGYLEPLSVKTSAGIPKPQLASALSSIQALRVEGPIALGEVLIENVAGTGVDVIATKPLGSRHS